MSTNKKIDPIEEFISLKWVNWAKESPDYDGMVFVRYESHRGIAISSNGEIISLDGCTDAETLSQYKKNVYWLKEIYTDEFHDYFRFDEE